MNLEGIHLVVGEQFYVVAQEVHRDEFSSTVEHHASDGVVGPVADAAFGKCQTLFRHLQQGTCSPEYTGVLRSGNHDAVIHLKGITFFTQLLVRVDLKHDVTFFRLSIPGVQAQADQLFEIVGQTLCHLLEHRVAFGVNNA